MSNRKMKVRGVEELLNRSTLCASSWRRFSDRPSIAMTTTRILLAAILGGIAMFIWNAIAHMALPLGHAGVSEIPNEEMVLATLKAGMAEKEGLYYFPGMGIGDNPTKEQEKAAMEQYPKKLETNPSGLMVYHPANSRP